MLNASSTMQRRVTPAALLIFFFACTALPHVAFAHLESVATPTLAVPAGAEPGEPPTLSLSEPSLLPLELAALPELPTASAGTSMATSLRSHLLAESRALRVPAIAFFPPDRASSGKASSSTDTASSHSDKAAEAPLWDLLPLLARGGAPGAAEAEPVPVVVLAGSAVHRLPAVAAVTPKLQRPSSNSDADADSDSDSGADASKVRSDNGGSAHVVAPSADAVFAAKTLNAVATATRSHILAALKSKDAFNDANDYDNTANIAAQTENAVRRYVLASPLCRAPLSATNINTNTNTAPGTGADVDADVDVALDPAAVALSAALARPDPLSPRAVAAALVLLHS